MATWRNPVAASLAVMSLLLMPVVAGCSADSGATVGSGQAYVAGDGSIVTLDPADRRPAPELAGTTLAGDPFSLAEHKGDVVVVNVWASWCAPCRTEAPGLAQVARDTRKDGVQFVGLVTRDSDASAKAFVSRFELDYPSVVDTDGSLQLLFRDNLPPQAIPSTLVIDREGRVAARVLGQITPTSLKDIIAPLAAERPASAAP